MTISKIIAVITHTAIFGLLIAGAALSPTPVAAADGTATVLHSFNEGLFGGQLVVGPDKFLYGYVNVLGASNNYATVFRASVSGVVKPLATIIGGYGLNDIIVASDGSLIATATANQENATGGSILRIGLNGAVTTLYQFSAANGPNPTAILLGEDGNYYGVTSNGGTSNDGTFYELSSSAPNSLMVLHNFGKGNGVAPIDLIQAADGSFYGTTAFLSTGNGTGTVFEVVANNNIKTIYSAKQSGGSSHPSGLIQAADGTIYGITIGTNNANGTIFSIDAAGTYTTDYTFTGGADGAVPVQLLQQARTGYIYGCTSSAGEFGHGTFFEFDLSSDTVSTIFNFDPPGPYYPSSIVLHPNDIFYGLSQMGGAENTGTLFKLTD